MELTIFGNTLEILHHPYSSREPGVEATTKVGASHLCFTHFIPYELYKLAIITEK